MFRTLALIVGISEYIDEEISRLVAASLDAKMVAQSFRNWGVCDNNIKLLVDDQATRSNILSAIRIWAVERSSPNTKFVFYFAGHGARTSGLLPESLLFAHDTSHGDPIDTGVSLSEIVKSVNRLNPIQSFLLFDACGLRLSEIKNPLDDPLDYNADLFDESLLSTTSAQALFCLFASGPHTAYESKTLQKGVFTDILLKCIAKLRNTNHNCNYLASMVEEKLKKRNFPSPESYHIGHQSVWLLPREDEESQKVEIEHKQVNLVYRSSLIAEIQDILLTSQFMWLWGESGSGKTTVIKQFHEGSNTISIYCSIPQVMHFAFSNIADILAEEMTIKYPSFSKVIEQNSSDKIFDLISTHQSNIILLIDHIDRLDEENTLKLITTILDSKVQTVFITRYLPSSEINSLHKDINVRKCSPLSTEETTELVKSFYKDNSFLDSASINLLQLKTKGNPLRLIQEIARGQNEVNNEINAILKKNDIKKVATAIVGCGGYIDENLFKETFDFKDETFTELEKFGLLIFSENKFLPHDSLSDLLSAEKIYPSKELVFSEYWVKQVELTPQNSWACRSLVESCIKFGVRSDYDKALVLAISSLLELKSWDILIALGHSLVEFNSSLNSILILAENLVRISQYELSRKLTSVILLTANDPIKLNNAKVIESERFWWCGNYNASKELSREVLISAQSEHLASWARLNIGISLFFEGEWTSATQNFNEIIECKNASPRTVAWGKSMIGTILGLRGVEVKKGQQFLASAEQMLIALNDFVGASVTANNLGEMMWKLGELRSSLPILSRGHQFAKKMKNSMLFLETLRNLVHVRLRLNGPFSSELEELIQTVNKFIEANDNEIETVEAMQLWNTFASMYAYRGDKKLLAKYLDKAIPLTIGNLEYEIYTFANLSLLEAFNKNISKSLKAFKKSIQLAIVGNNFLAIKQIMNDIQSVSLHFKDNFFKKHTDYIRKINETKLLSTTSPAKNKKQTPTFRRKKR